MLIEFFKKLGKSKWLHWVGTAPFILIPIVIFFGGDVSRGVGILAVLASMWIGVILGGKFALIISTFLLKSSEDIGKRLEVAFCAFGFLFLPVLVGTFTNANLGTDIEMSSMAAHFLGACIGAGIFFCISPEDSDNVS
ncbi:hypothetical protein [uncultured Tateyamaria sp.]|uniref:hypothetical protein n=1 Tax=uncultured Tateyamaria sp. TaxID=455651 RepID=UPI0026120E09|nr:hypothetical protein [uncultured Tateyamaria sp.]